jgi:hypothetical protein
LCEEEVFDELLTYARDNRVDVEGDIEEFSDEPKQMLHKLLELVPKDGTVYKMPTDLLQHLGFSFGINSKRDLAIKLGRLGFRTRVLSLNGEYARYYVLTSYRIEDAIGRL